jgi:16S rRNA (guanine(966)-N(2))-methyltransferase RsmD
MRIISGTLGGRRFHPPQLPHTRPTTDFGKTGLFNILNNLIDFGECNVLDLFSGTGSISFEFVSRGSPRVVAVEKDLKCITFIKKMKAEWGLDALELIPYEVFRYLENAREKFDVIFAGPPYPLPNIADLPAIIFRQPLLHQNGWFILETDRRHRFDTHPAFRRVVNYGQTTFHFFRNEH